MFICAVISVVKQILITILMRRSTRTYSPLGLLITAEREALGVRVKDFCQLAGISSRTYTNLLFGKMCICRAVQRCYIASWSIMMRRHMPILHYAM